MEGLSARLLQPGFAGGVAGAESGDEFKKKPTNFGSLLLLRTGSREHNVYLIEHAKQTGLRWDPYHGMFDGHGKRLAVAEVADIFKVLELDFVPPERWER